MKRMILSMLAGALLGCATLAAVSCAHRPGPSPPDLASHAAAAPIEIADASSACGRGCANERRLGCPEGWAIRDGAPSCYEICLKTTTARLVGQDPECWAEAGTREELRARCGVRCAQ